MQQVVLPDTPPPQTCLETAVDFPLDKPGAPTVPNRPIRVRLGYVFPSMETEARQFVLDPDSVPIATALRVIALHNEGQECLDRFTTSLADVLMPEGYACLPRRGDNHSVQYHSHGSSTPALAMRARRKSLRSMRGKVEKYESLSDADLEVMVANGYQPRFERDPETGDRLYTIADGSGLVIIAPTVDVIYTVVAPTLHQRINVRGKKDYIANPKPMTGYRSLHIIGFARDSPFMMEIQVRTPEMDRAAQLDLAGQYHCDKRIYTTPPPSVDRRQRAVI